LTAFLKYCILTKVSAYQQIGGELKVYTIHKIPVVQEQMFTQTTHEDWKFLCLRLQNGVHNIWIQVDDEKPKLNYTFRIYNTGNIISNPENAEYLCTYGIDECIHHLYVEREALSIWDKIKKFLVSAIMYNH
jgi:hypothetical protein